MRSPPPPNNPPATANKDDKAESKTIKARPKPKPKPAKPVATISKQSMGYFIVKDIESATSYVKSEWSRFALKELLDNAWEWLNDNYPADDKHKRKIVSFTGPRTVFQICINIGRTFRTAKREIFVFSIFVDYEFVYAIIFFLLEV